MNAYVTHPYSLLGASLIGALLWEGHQLASSIREADVVFETATGVVYRTDRAVASFVFSELLSPGDVSETEVGQWLERYVADGQFPELEGGVHVADARDVALAMLIVAERGLSGEFDVVGPYISFAELADICLGMGSARPNVAIPELNVTFRSVDETIHDVLGYLRSHERAPSAASMVA